MREALRTYEEYKDSGLAWLGDIPKSWELTFLVKVLSSLVDYRGRTPQKVGFDENGMLLVTAKNIKQGRIDYLLSEEFVDIDDVQSLLNRGKPEVGDVLFTTEAPLGEVANVDRTGFALAQRIIKFRGNKKALNNYFMKYWLMSSTFQYSLQRHATGSTAQGLKGSKVRLLNIVLPNLTEQKAIAHYLDTKTAQIDRKIDLLTQKAQRYEELKRSLINETVTRGLDKSVPMKDSAIEWIGEIPEHWEEKRIKDLSFLQSGINITSEQIEDEGEYPVYGGNGIRGYFSNYTNNGKYILIGRQGALCGNINHASGKFWATEHAVVVYHNKGVDVGWYGAMLQVMNLNQYSISAAQPGLAVDRIKRLFLPVPPVNEQKAIAKFLDEKTGQIDQIIENISIQIEIQKELRKTLINDVVTGKIKVA